MSAHRRRQPPSSTEFRWCSGCCGIARRECCSGSPVAETEHHESTHPQAERRGLHCASFTRVHWENDMTRTFKAVPAIALALALFDGAAHAQTIKIGVNEPLTGAFAASGT